MRKHSSTVGHCERHPERVEDNQGQHSIARAANIEQRTRDTWVEAGAVGVVEEGEGEAEKEKMDNCT